jgi:hypothetical protein
MKRTLLIARREFMAYVRTVGFWLSLLSLPIFGLLGGVIPLLVKSSEPMREVVLIEEGRRPWVWRRPCRTSWPPTPNGERNGPQTPPRRRRAPPAAPSIPRPRATPSPP